MGLYRIKAARIEDCDGYRCRRVRGFIAQRRVQVLGVFGFWWPVGEWRRSDIEAQADARRDADLRRPLPRPREFRYD